MLKRSWQEHHSGRGSSSSDTAGPQQQQQQQASFFPPSQSSSSSSSKKSRLVLVSEQQQYQQDASLLHLVGRKILLSPLSGGRRLQAQSQQQHQLKPVTSAAFAFNPSTSYSGYTPVKLFATPRMSVTKPSLESQPQTPTFQQLQTPLRQQHQQLRQNSAMLQQIAPLPSADERMQTGQVLKRIQDLQLLSERPPSAASESTSSASLASASSSAVVSFTPLPATTTRSNTPSVIDSLSETKAHISKLIEDIKSKYKVLSEKDSAAVNNVEERRKQASQPKADHNCPPLSEEAAAAVKKCLKRSDGGEVVEGFKVSLTTNDMEKLRPTAWLNDEVINFYLQLIVNRSETNASLPKVFAFSTFFFLKLSEGGYQEVRRWSKKVDIFAQDHILVPVHLGVHWCLANINVAKKRFEYYDSLHGRNPDVFKWLREYIKNEHQSKKNGPIDLSGWTDYEPGNSPTQENGYDCGVFTCINAEFVSRNEPQTFTQSQMPYFRQRMVWEILQKKLLVGGGL